MAHGHPMRYIALSLLAATLIARAASDHGDAVAESAAVAPASLRAQPWAIRARTTRPADAPEMQSAPVPRLLPDVYRLAMRLGYQSWLDGNWEIVLGMGDGTEAESLTRNPAQDEAPSLGDGCRLLAFSSDREDGVGGQNDDIHLMQSDGTQLARLTTDAGRDVLPALSPDGSRVAFQSYREGNQADIYVMAASPTSPASRLTHSSAYDGQPDWSPDAQQITFITDRGGSSNVWVMDSDGTDARQVTIMPHAGGPKWSPDGSRIAFASDDIGTGFTSLWVINTDGSNPRLLWRPSASDTDAWPGDWSFDSRYIVHEEATWGYDAEWYIINSSLNAIDADNPTDRFRLVDGGINMAATWGQCAVAGPSSWVAPLPVVSTGPLLISWAGTGQAPLEYQVQYRLGGTSEWLDWALDLPNAWTQLTSALFTPPRNGVFVYFRCRARDALGTIEDWPGSADAHVSFPATISGTVRDSHGVPIVGATVRGPTPLQSSAVSRIDGHYELEASAEGDSALGVSALGYAAVHLGRPALTDMVNIDFHLGTQAELVSNGGFENGQIGWYASPGIDFVSRAYAFDSCLVDLRPGRLAAATVSTGDQSAQIASIRQYVDVPTDIHRPTLSLGFSIGDGLGRPVGTLSTVIATSTAGETIVSSSGHATTWANVGTERAYPEWEHATADLSEWRGQKILLEVRYEAGSTNSHAMVDNVSISPWLTPLTLQVEPSQLRPGHEGTITVRGDNYVIDASERTGPQISLGQFALATTFVEAITLHATVPATIPLGIYDLWVRNPSAHRSGLPDAFVIGGRTAIPLVLSNPGD